MDTQTVQLQGFDVYLKQAMAQIKAHAWSYLGLYILNLVLVIVAVPFLLGPSVTFGVLAFTTTGASLDIYIGISILFFCLFFLAIIYFSSVMFKAFYSVTVENVGGAHAFEQAFTRSRQVFTTVLLQNLFVFGYMMVVSLIFIGGPLSLVLLNKDMLALSLILIIFALPLLLVAMVFLVFIRLSVFASAEANLGGFAAMSRSIRLVKGNFLSVTGRLFLLALVAIGIQMIISFITMPLSIMGQYYDSISILSSLVNLLLGQVAQFFIMFLGFTFTLSLYKDLVSQKPLTQDERSGRAVLYIFTGIGLVLTVLIISGLGYGGKIFVESGAMNSLKDGFATQMKLIEQQQNKQMLENTINTQMDTTPMPPQLVPQSR